MTTSTPPGGDEIHREHRRKIDFMLRSAAALVSTSVVTSGLGFLYWAVAARSFDAVDVGESATAIAAMSVIAPFTVSGMGTLLIVELPRLQKDRARLVTTAALASGALGSLIALLCAFLLPGKFLGLPDIGKQAGITALFVAATATQAIGSLLDSALLSMVGGGMQLRRNAIQAAVKLALLIAFALALNHFGSLSIFASWFLANVVSIVAVAFLLARRFGITLGQFIPKPSMLHGLHLNAARHHMLNTSLFVPYFAMPIVANVVLGSEQAGYLYATWSVAGFIFFLPISLATVLFASGARDTSTFGLEYRFTLRFSLLICIAANIGVLLFGGLVLKVFGDAYAENGHTALMLMALGGLGLIIKDHHVVVARVTGAVGREALLIGLLGVGELAGAAIGAARGGLTGLAAGWLIAIMVEVAVCAPLVWRAYQGRIAATTPADGSEFDIGGVVQ